jgi:glycerol uptake facilitator protein
VAVSSRLSVESPAQSLPGVILAEAFGTFLLVFFGCGVVHASVLTGAQQGLWQVAVVWGIAIGLAIFAVDKISGAHINPAMTISFAVWGRHPWSRVLPYLIAQLSGAILAAACLYVLFGGMLAKKEAEKRVVRGEPGSIVTAMCYGEYFPNPGGVATAPGPYDPAAWSALQSTVTPTQAMFAEFIGTMILAMVVFALTDSNNTARPAANLVPIFIGLTVSILISVLAPLTQAGFNPARDFGPRLFAASVGWGQVALPTKDNIHWLTVYTLAPIAGAVVGGGLHQRIFHPLHRKRNPL